MERIEIDAKVDHLKALARARVDAVRPRIREGVTRAQWNLRSNPAKWAGIAAGAGFVLGLGGRILRRRARLHRVPQLVVIETAC